MWKELKDWLLLVVVFLCVFVVLRLANAAAYDRRTDDVEVDYGRACMALVLYSEQDELSPDGMTIVARVLLNRLADPSNRYGLTLCDVAFQGHQFAGVEGWRYPREPGRVNPVRWDLAMKITNMTIAGTAELPGQCIGKRPVLYFHSGDRAYWSGRLQLLCKVDGHYFYSEKGP